MVFVDGDDLVEVTKPGLAYIVLGGFTVAFSMISLLVKEKLYINEVVLGTGFGVLMGPHVANAFNPAGWSDSEEGYRKITLEVMRIVLATGLFAIGVELPKNYMAKHAKGLLVMVVPTMAIGWVIVAALLKALFPILDFISCLVVAACLTPTDPVISAAIVGGKFAVKHVPINIRQIIAAESAANDGLAYPFLSIAIYLTMEASTGVAVGKWFLVGWLYEVILGTVLGALLGLAFSWIMRVSHQRGYLDHESYVAQYLSLSLLTIGIASTIGSDDLLAAFAAGSAISWDGSFNTHTEDEVFVSVIDQLLNCACFIYIGAWLPFTDFNLPEFGVVPWRLIVLFIAILVLRRFPSIMMLFNWVPEIKNWKEALFTGHFGPMGVGAVFISTIALERLPEPGEHPTTQPEILARILQPIVSFIVLGSIIVHGLSIPFFSFGKRTISLTMSSTFGNSRTETHDYVRSLVGRPAPVFHSGKPPTSGTPSLSSRPASIKAPVTVGAHTAASSPGSLSRTPSRRASGELISDISPDEMENGLAKPGVRFAMENDNTVVHSIGRESGVRE